MTYFPERVGIASISLARSLTVGLAISIAIVRPTLAATERIVPGGVADSFPGVYAPQVRATVPPFILSVTPGNGPTKGGQAVTIRGRFFQPGPTIVFDRVFATSVIYVSESELTCLTPPHALGAVTVEVINVDTRTSALPEGYLYVNVTTANPASIASSVSPVGPAASIASSVSPVGPAASIASSVSPPSSVVMSPSSALVIANVTVTHGKEGAPTVIRIDLHGKQAADAAVVAIPSIVKRYGLLK